MVILEIALKSVNEREEEDARKVHEILRPIQRQHREEGLQNRFEHCWLQKKGGILQYHHNPLHRKHLPLQRRVIFVLHHSIPKIEDILDVLFEKILKLLLRGDGNCGKERSEGGERRTVRWDGKRSVLEESGWVMCDGVSEEKEEENGRRNRRSV